MLQAGPQEEGDRVKTKPVSCSTVEVEGTALKRKSDQLQHDYEERTSADPPAPRKVSKIGFSMSNQIGKKSNAISIKLGATVSVTQCTLLSLFTSVIGVNVLESFFILFVLQPVTETQRTCTVSSSKKARAGICV